MKDPLPIPTSPCVIAKGSVTPAGYVNKYTYERGVMGAHRYALGKLLGFDRIKGQVVMHSCDNRKCINVDHLFVGSESINSKSAYHRGTKKLTPGMNKYSDEFKAEALTLLDGGMNVKQVCSKLKIHPSTLYKWMI